MPCSLWPLHAMQLVVLPSKIQLLMQLFGEGRIPSVQGAARIVGDCKLHRALCGFCMQGPVLGMPHARSWPEESLNMYGHTYVWVRMLIFFQFRLPFLNQTPNLSDIALQARTVSRMTH